MDSPKEDIIRHLRGSKKNICQAKKDFTDSCQLTFLSTFLSASLSIMEKLKAKPGVPKHDRLIKITRRMTTGHRTQMRMPKRRLEEYLWTLPMYVDDGTLC